VAHGGAVTLLCADIESPARLPQAPGESYADVLAAQREMVRTTVAAHGGSEIYNQGAASCFAFPRARDALACGWGCIAVSRG
jgi:class 3 adenylate cyclase